jgi:hypothetical protein
LDGGRIHNRVTICRITLLDIKIPLFLTSTESTNDSAGKSCTTPGNTAGKALQILFKVLTERHASSKTTVENVDRKIKSKDTQALG